MHYKTAFYRVAYVFNLSGEKTAYTYYQFINAHLLIHMLITKSGNDERKAWMQNHRR